MLGKAVYQSQINRIMDFRFCRNSALPLWISQRDDSADLCIKITVSIVTLLGLPNLGCLNQKKVVKRFYFV